MLFALLCLVATLLALVGLFLLCAAAEYTVRYVIDKLIGEDEPPNKEK